MAAGQYSSFAITGDKHVFAWGLNNFGQLGLVDPKVVLVPTLVESLTGRGVVDVAAGQHHSLATTEVHSLT